MKNLKEKLYKNSGFTLMEMLIVIAIIAILIAIAIPTFSGQLEQAREGVDAANIRSEYAKIMMEVLLDPDNVANHTVSLEQQKPGWQNSDIPASLAKLSNDDLTVTIGSFTSGTKATLTYTAASGSTSAKLDITFGS